MSDRTSPHDIERAVADTLSAIAIDFRVLRWTSDTTAIVEIARSGVRAEYQMVWMSHVTLSALSRTDRQDHRYELLVTGPHISSRTAEALRAANIDYIDNVGNAHLNFDPVLVDIRGRPSIAPRKGRGTTEANLFSARRMQVLFALLAWPDLVDRPVRMIADTAGTSVGLAQSTLEIMKESDYVVGRSLYRRDELIDLWTAAYGNTLIPKLRETSFAGEVASWSPPPGWQVSGESAVQLIRQPQTLTIYVKNFDPIEAVQSGWHKSSDPNIEIRRKFWGEPPWATAPEQYGAFTESAAPPLMVYADLLASKDPRQTEVATALRRDHLV
ncbi:type IV toxin-antitoxin system AbiEi family antitoxin [Nocardia neocaledoniensis]|uniref:type IV toxin-antitoxin system AbiEi family antitoxin n=1 Tax=Nocardia neocaledoniensis TaxID=236511 RepID=UPI0024545A62|nr:type IV toxin-antitoxin system AbiEi family antitoxin [Nocardia neocaledoniensis]